VFATPKNDSVSGCHMTGEDSMRMSRKNCSPFWRSASLTMSSLPNMLDPLGKGMSSHGNQI